MKPVHELSNGELALEVAEFVKPDIKWTISGNGAVWDVNRIVPSSSYFFINLETINPIWQECMDDVIEAKIKEINPDYYNSWAFMFEWLRQIKTPRQQAEAICEYKRGLK